MKRTILVLFAIEALTGSVAYAPAPGQPVNRDAALIAEGKLPPDYRGWRLISVAHEAGDLNDLRAVLGKDLAIDAFRR
jgi:hypothetical protein